MISQNGFNTEKKVNQYRVLTTKASLLRHLTDQTYQCQGKFVSKGRFI